MGEALTKAMLAFHESGHAVAAVTLGHDLRSVSISDVPAHALVRFKPGAWLDELVVLAAGDVAVRTAGGQDRSWADADEATDLIARRGLDLMETVYARQRAEALIDRHWQAVERLAARLLNVGRLSGAETRNLVAGGTDDKGTALLLGLAMAARNGDMSKKG